MAENESREQLSTRRGDGLAPLDAIEDVGKLLQVHPLIGGKLAILRFLLGEYLIEDIDDGKQDFAIALAEGLVQPRDDVRFAVEVRIGRLDEWPFVEQIQGPAGDSLLGDGDLPLALVGHVLGPFARIIGDVPEAKAGIARVV